MDRQNLPLHNPYVILSDFLIDSSKFPMKKLFKIALTVSLSGFGSIFLNSFDYGNQLKAETIKSTTTNIHLQKSSLVKRDIIAQKTSNFNAVAAEKFGDDFLVAWKAGKSSKFIPDKIELNEFMYLAFGDEYINTSAQDKHYMQFYLFDSLRVLHTNPALIFVYKTMIFKKKSLSKIGDVYVYSYTSQIPGQPIRDGAIRIKEVDGQLQIADIKSNFWLTNYLKEQYSFARNKLSLIDFMKSLGIELRRQWGA